MLQYFITFTHSFIKGMLLSDSFYIVDLNNNVNNSKLGKWYNNHRASQYMKKN